MRTNTYNNLLKKNKDWVVEKLMADSSYFEGVIKKQNPSSFVVECSDGRASVSTYTNSELGELFLYRNPANQASNTDKGFLAALEFAVRSLHVEHIIVSGHYDCLAVEAAFNDSASGSLNSWLMDVKFLKDKNKNLLSKLKHENDKIDLLTELNVIKQIENTLKTTIIKEEFRRKNYVKIHGWISNIRTGVIKELRLPTKDWRKVGLIPIDYIV